MNPECRTPKEIADGIAHYWLQLPDDGRLKVTADLANELSRQDRRTLIGLVSWNTLEAFQPSASDVLFAGIAPEIPSPKPLVNEPKKTQRWRWSLTPLSWAIAIFLMACVTWRVLGGQAALELGLATLLFIGGVIVGGCDR